MKTKEKIATSCAIILSALLSGISVYYVMRNCNTPLKPTMKPHDSGVHKSGLTGLIDCLDKMEIPLKLPPGSDSLFKTLNKNCYINNWEHSEYLKITSRNVSAI